MDFSPSPVASAVGAFLPAFPALFLIVNPVGGALIFDSVAGDGSPADKRAIPHGGFGRDAGS